METPVDLPGMVLGGEIHPELAEPSHGLRMRDSTVSAAPLGVIRCDLVPHSGCAPRLWPEKTL